MFPLSDKWVYVLSFWFPFWFVRQEAMVWFSNTKTLKDFGHG
jgi:hypothetical protein